MRALLAAVSALGLLSALPAFAEEGARQTGVQFNVGYTHLFADIFDDIDMGAVTTRLGYRFHTNFGVEGETAAGILRSDSDLSPFGLPGGRVKLKSELAAYAVGYLPLSEKIAAFARLGYGVQDIKITALGASTTSDWESVNYGAGLEYALSPRSGVRGEYTKHDYKTGRRDLDTLSLSYVRKF